MTVIRSNPALLLEYNKLEQQVKEYKRLYSNSNPNQRLADPNGLITIQVVVHIIHRTGEAIGVGANLSDAQVQSQITVLNEDFSRTNPNANQTPSVFTGVDKILFQTIKFRTPQYKRQKRLKNRRFASAFGIYTEGSPFSHF